MPSHSAILTENFSSQTFCKIHINHGDYNKTKQENTNKNSYPSEHMWGIGFQVNT